MAKIIIPTPLRKFTDSSSTFDAPGKTVGDSIQELVRAFPDLKNHLLDKEGNVRSYVNVFVGEENIRSLEKEHTVVDDHTVISIVPAIAGGAH